MSSASSSLALSIFTACTLAACAADPVEDDLGASSESALTSIPDVRPPGTGCLATRAGAGPDDDVLLRIEFHGIDQVDYRRPDKIVLKTFRADGRQGTASRGDADYEFNTVSALKKPNGTVELYRGDTGSLESRRIAVLKPKGDGFSFEVKGTLYPSMPGWTNQRATAVCNFQDPAKFPAIPGQTAAEVDLAPIQTVGSDFAFPRPLRAMTCRASERTSTGLRLEIAIAPGRDGSDDVAMATIRGQDERGFTRELAQTLFVRRGFSDSTLGLENVQNARFGEIRTSLVSFTPRTTYGIYYEPPIVARIPEVGREKIRLNCQ